MRCPVPTYAQHVGQVFSDCVDDMSVPQTPAHFTTWLGILAVSLVGAGQLSFSSKMSKGRGTLRYGGCYVAGFCSPSLADNGKHFTGGFSLVGNGGERR